MDPPEDTGYLYPHVLLQPRARCRLIGEKLAAQHPAGFRFPRRSLDEYQVGMGIQTTPVTWMVLPAYFWSNSGSAWCCSKSWSGVNVFPVCRSTEGPVPVISTEHGSSVPPNALEKPDRGPVTLTGKFGVRGVTDAV